MSPNPSKEALMPFETSHKNWFAVAQKMLSAEVVKEPGNSFRWESKEVTPCCWWVFSGVTADESHVFSPSELRFVDDRLAAFGISATRTEDNRPGSIFVADPFNDGKQLAETVVIGNPFIPLSCSNLYLPAPIKKFIAVAALLDEDMWRQVNQQGLLLYEPLVGWPNPLMLAFTGRHIGLKQDALYPVDTIGRQPDKVLKHVTDSFRPVAVRWDIKNDTN